MVRGICMAPNCCTESGERSTQDTTRFFTCTFCKESSNSRSFLVLLKSKFPTSFWLKCLSLVKLKQTDINVLQLFFILCPWKLSQNTNDFKSRERQRDREWATWTVRSFSSITSDTNYTLQFWRLKLSYCRLRRSNTLDDFGHLLSDGR